MVSERRYPAPDSDWWTSKQGKGMCRKCGEERLVHRVIDGWGEQNFCQVCSNSWVVKSHAEWKTREQAGVPISGSTGD
jgi:hypothetical protein